MVTTSGASGGTQPAATPAASAVHFAADGLPGDVPLYDEATGRLQWTYASKSKQEHDQLLADLEREMNRHLSKVSPEDSEVEKAKKLYHSFCTSVTYSDEAMVTREKVEAYYGFTEHTGICYTFADDHGYLLSMVGTEGNTVSASIDTDGGDELGHIWNLVTLNGKRYFCDPTYELSIEGGKGYAFFGMTMEDRLLDGTKWIEDSVIVGLYDGLSIEQADIATSRLTVDP